MLPERALGNGLETSAGTAAVRTLVISDLVDSTGFVERVGDRRVARFMGHHDRLARDIMARHGGLEIDKTDGFLILFKRPVSAVRFALEYHEALARLAKAKNYDVSTRVGIHLGEVFLRENPPADVARGAKPLEVEGLAKPVSARLMSLAQGRQTLMTRPVFDVARRAMVGSREPGPELVWVSHGNYRLKGVTDSLEVCEVGVQGFAPLRPPADSEKARHATAVQPMPGPRARAGSESPGPQPRRRRVAGVAGVALVGLLVGLWTSFPKGTRLKLDVDGPVKVALAGFEAAGAGGGPEWLPDALTEMLAFELEQRPGLEPVSLDEPGGAGTDRMEEIRQKTGAHVLAMGSYRTANDGTEVGIDVELRAADPTRTVRLSGRRRPLDRSDGLVARLGEEIAAAVGRRAPVAAGSGAAEPPPGNAGRLYASGVEDLRRLDFPAAYRHLVEALDGAPDNVMLRRTLASAAWQLGRTKEAREHAEAAFAAAAGLARKERLWCRALLLAAQRQWRRAAALASFLSVRGVDAESDPEEELERGLDTVLWQALGGWPDLAKTTLEELRGLPAPYRDDPRLDLVWAKVAGYLREPERQLEAARRAGQRSDAPLVVARARQLEAEALLPLGRLAEAAKALEEARDVYRRHGQPKGQADAVYFLGIVSSYRQKLAEAELHYDQAQRIYGTIGDLYMRARALSNKALALSALGDLEGSLAVWRQTLGTMDEDRLGRALTRFNMMQTLLQLGRLDEARKEYDRAERTLDEIGDRSQRGKALTFLGQLLLEQGRLSEAGERLDEAIQTRSREGDDLGAALARASLAEVRLHLGDLEGAAEILQDLVDFYDGSSPGDAASARSRLGDVFLARGDLAAARQLYEAAHETFTVLGDSTSLAATELSTASLLLAEGKTGEALSRTRAWLNTFELGKQRLREVETRELLARCLLTQGRLADARSQIEAIHRLPEAGEASLYQLPVELTEARIKIAEGRVEEAEKMLIDAQATASLEGRRATELEIQLASAELSLAAGDAARARDLFRSAQDRAEAGGFGLIARRAADRVRNH